MIYTVSDIHGCYNKYRKLLKKINFGPDDTLYVLGDVIDRGPDGFKILLDMARRSNVINLMGNHEAMAVQALSHILCVVQQGSGSALSEEAEEDVGLWFYNGGELSLADFLWLNEEETQTVWLLFLLQLHYTGFGVPFVYFFKLFFLFFPSRSFSSSPLSCLLFSRLPFA